jgi:hypothetical protein
VRSRQSGQPRDRSPNQRAARKCSLLRPSSGSPSTSAGRWSGLRPSLASADGPRSRSWMRSTPASCSVGDGPSAITAGAAGQKDNNGRWGALSTGLGCCTSVLCCPSLAAPGSEQRREDAPNAARCCSRSCGAWTERRGVPACASSSCSLRTSPQRAATETLVRYAVVITFLVIALIAVGLIKYARSQIRMAARPSLPAALGAIRRSRLVAPGASGQCTCGGIIGPCGMVSPRHGPLLTCTGCGQTWTSDGRRIVLRRRTRAARQRRH